MAYRETAKTRAKKAETHQRILRTCYEQLNSSGFNELTMAKVARQTGIATGSLYRYFPNKSELLAEIFAYCTQHEVNAVAAVVAAAKAPTDKLYGAVETFCFRAISSPKLAWALIAEPVAPEVEQQRLQFRKAYTDIFAQIISAGMKSGEFAHQNACVSAAAIVGVLGQVLLEPLQQSRTDQSFDDLETKTQKALISITGEITRLIVRMVGGKTGHQAERETDHVCK